MPSLAQSREPFRLDERNHIERPLLDQFAWAGRSSTSRTSNRPRPTHIGRASPTS